MGRLLLILVLCAGAALGQQGKGTIKGQVSDEFGGVIVGASVIAVDASGATKSVTTNGEGNFVLNGLAPGKYTIKVSATGFAAYEDAAVEALAGRSQQLDVTLKVTIDQQRVTVAADSTGVDTDPANNVGATVIKGSDLESLPDDPDDLAAALQALAGPGAGPNGGQIFIDGFSGGRLPPLSSIREIRINSNPFSAEYDRPGQGRIEILTRPGTDRFRGQASFGFNNQSLNSRNPFASTRPPYSSRQYGGNLSGPISKKASFFLDFEKRDIDDQAIINATVLDASLNIVSLSESVAIPNRRTSFSPRVDYQLNASNTLVARYEYEHSSSITGVGGFSLASRKYSAFSTQQTARLTETAILNKKTVNETRFQFNHQTSGDTANNSIPTNSVQEAFTGGGSQIGLTSNQTNSWELTNNTSLAMGMHTVRFGARVRGTSITSISPQNFGGTWTFAGSKQFGNPDGLTSIEVYQVTLKGLQAALPPAAIRLAGGGATQFTIAAGNPKATVRQIDFGGFAQDDWKMRPNLTLSFGLRYENQSNISSNLNFAPRAGFAWQPGGANPRQPAKMTIRGGLGVFYDRVSQNLTLTANRLNGTNQQQYIVTDPTILNSFPVIPTIDVLTAFKTPVSIYDLADNIQAPYSIQSVISVERVLPHNFRASATFSHTRSLHVLRARATNAPLPGTFVPALPGSGIRPQGSVNNFFEYDSSGRFDQNQFIVTFGGQLRRNMNLNVVYTYGLAHSDTDGSGTFAANPYNFSEEYGRSSTDIRHRFVVTGSFRAPWGISLNPFVIVTSGRPFNITIGRDMNGDTLFTDRPALATDLAKPGVIITKFGAFDPNPLPGTPIISRNFASGPSALTTNLRVSKTWGFGGERRTASTQTPGQSNRGTDGGAPRGFGGAPGGGGGARGGGGGGGARGGGGGGGGGRGGGGFGGGGDTAQRYNLTFSVNFQNILNHANLGQPIGNLSSSLFGLSNSSGGGFGGFGGGRGGGGSSPYNRLIEASLRFSF